MINTTEKVVEIANFLKKGDVTKAANLAIVSLGSTDDAVSFRNFVLRLRLFWFATVYKIVHGDA